MNIEGVTFPIVLTFAGKAQTAGSKRSFVPKGKDGQPYRRPNGTILVNTVDDNKRSKGWKSDVRTSAEINYLGPALTCALRVEMIFYSLRPKGHFGTGRNEGIVKDSAPAYPAKKPDVLKLARAIEDALTGVVWRDDSLIVDEYIGKRFADREYVTVRVWMSEAQQVDDLVALGQISPPGPSDCFEQLSLADAA